MLRTIHVDRLRPGMHIQRLNGPWLKHPFWRTSFLATEHDIERLRASDVESVEIDVRLGVDVHEQATGTGDAPAAPVQDAVVEAQVPRPTAILPATLESELSRARRICREGRDAVEAMFREVRMGRMVDPTAMLPWPRKSPHRSSAIPAH